mmetsp:Transcript_17992/g.44645  ORF Transcript_17992/g.44645 Transcript_17992/m.44645 type:complete len:222 (-) Transcript_17992:3554-4219(-)
MVITKFSPGLNLLFLKLKFDVESPLSSAALKLVPGLALGIFDGVPQILPAAPVEPQVRPLEHSEQCVAQRRRVEGLAHAAVHPGALHLLGVLGPHVGRQPHDHVRLLALRLLHLPDLDGGLRPVHHRHHEVHQDAVEVGQVVGKPLPDHVHRLLAVHGDLEFRPALDDGELGHLLVHRVVLHQQHAHALELPLRRVPLHLHALDHHVAVIRRVIHRRLDLA